MSVAVYDDDELAGLAEALGGDPKIIEAVGALGIANRAACLLSYADEERMYRPDMSVEPRPKPDWAKTLTAWTSNLLYNCVSNGGRDYAPSRDKRFVIARARQADHNGHGSG